MKASTPQQTPQIAGTSPLASPVAPRPSPKTLRDCLAYRAAIRWPHDWDKDWDKDPDGDWTRSWDKDWDRALHRPGMGWERDRPDFRDLHAASPGIDPILARSKPLKSAQATLPASADLRAWCPAIEFQGPLGSCTAHAGVGLVEYFQRRAFGQHIDASRLFLYKATRDLLEWRGDQGAYLRTTMKALALFGVPPERYWPYDIPRFDDDPPALCFAYGQSFRSIRYYRLDTPGLAPSAVLTRVRTSLAAGLPAMFGFSTYGSMPAIGSGSGDIPFPDPEDSETGGHAVVAVGYDDSRVIGAHKGALLIRNSWSVDWGEAGYGWLPYAYVEAGLAVDFWTLVQAEFIDTDIFA